jgi:membrane protease YdiL (CAAX protease family)
LRRTSKPDFQNFEKGSMIPPDDKTSMPQDEQEASAWSESSATASEEANTLPGDPVAYAASQPPSFVIPPRVYPEDLCVSWSWPHLIIFLLYGFASLIVVQTAFAIYYAPHDHHLSTKALEQYLISKPQFAIGSMLSWYASLFFFLYITLALLRNHPFWRSLGWRKLRTTAAGTSKNPIIYFFAGCGLSLFVAFATSRVQTPKDLPVEELFKNRNTALLFMAMAVLIAPLVEETIFRGYLYPVLARSFGVVTGIVTTGILFGLMHGAQLGWTWTLVALLTFVGVVLTIVRARTGTVLASYMLHLGYNSFIAITALIATHGFTRFPSAH